MVIRAGHMLATAERWRRQSSLGRQAVGFYWSTKTIFTMPLLISAALVHNESPKDGPPPKRRHLRPANGAALVGQRRSVRHRFPRACGDYSFDRSSEPKRRNPWHLSWRTSAGPLCSSPVPYPDTVLAA